MDHIRVSYQAQGRANEILNEFGDKIAAEVLCDELVDAEVSGYEKTWKINGDDVLIGVQKLQSIKTGGTYEPDI